MTHELDGYPRAILNEKMILRDHYTRLASAKKDVGEAAKGKDGKYDPCASSPELTAAHEERDRWDRAVYEQRARVEMLEREYEAVLLRAKAVAGLPTRTTPGPPNSLPVPSMEWPENAVSEEDAT